MDKSNPRVYRSSKPRGLPRSSNPKFSSRPSSHSNHRSSLGHSNPRPYSFDFKPRGLSGPPNPRGISGPLNPKGLSDPPKPNRFKDLPKLPLVKAESIGVWHVDTLELESKVLGNELKNLDSKSVMGWNSLVEKKTDLAERLLAQYTQDFEFSRGRSGDVKMLIATQRSGTASDKVSAFSVMVAENPISNLRSLDSLLAMVLSKVGKRHALSGFETLRELFITSLLPDRKLKSLFQRPLNHLPESKDGYSLLLFWYFEECMKQRYERFIIALEEASRDMLPILKDKALKTIYVLLKCKPEQERRLLSTLVNKLGDPENKAASNADFHLSNLLSEHPNMMAVVIDELDSFLFRPHLGLQSKYYAVNFLTQLRLSHKGDGPKLAKRLIDVYLAMFKVTISMKTSEQTIDKSQKGFNKESSRSFIKKKAATSVGTHVEMDSRILSAILTGVNRAFPFVSSDEVDDLIEVQTPMLFQLVHSKNFNVSVQALMLLDKISAKNQIINERFFRALYAKMLLPSAMNSSKAEMFIGLLLRAIKADVNLKRVSAFSKRLLQVALQQPPQYVCGCLFLLSEVLKARPPLWNMVLQNESVDDDDVEHFKDIVEETDNKPIMASKEPDIENDSADPDRDDVDDSPAFDYDDDSDEPDELIMGKHLAVQSKPMPDQDSEKPPQSNKRTSLPGGYDPRLREPSYCNADRVSWWELSVLASHVHPSVSTMAKTLLSGANIVYNGNPLNDLSLTAFLNKFMEKKPKQTRWHGASLIEPAKKLDMNNHLIGAEILSLAEEDVPPEDLVFHKFYTNKMSSSKKPKKKKKTLSDEAAENLFDLDDGEMDGGDESDNDEIEDMLDSADIGLESDGEYDYDDLDQVVNEDEDLVGHASDLDIISDAEGGDRDSDMEDNGIDADMSSGKKRKRKSGGNTGEVTPFASLKEYQHLIDEDGFLEKKVNSRKQFKKKKNLVSYENPIDEKRKSNSNKKSQGQAHEGNPKPEKKSKSISEDDNVKEKAKLKKKIKSRRYLSSLYTNGEI